MKLPTRATVWPRGLLLNEKQVQKLREVRTKTSVVPQSLSTLAIQSVATNLTRFIDVPDSPLKYLPNTIVQQLLSKIAPDFRQEKPLMMEVLGLLVNSNVTELDFTDFKSGASEYYKVLRSNNYLFKHALENCPKIRKIKLVGELRRNFRCSNIWTIESLKNSWNNLTTIICNEEFIFKDKIMVFLLENFPNIEELTVGLFITELTAAQTVLHHFINLKRLHTLNLLKIDKGTTAALLSSKSVVPEFLSDVAGGVPSLQNFGAQNASAEFIDLFGEKYPYKKLLVDELRIIKKGLNRKWPKNLSVKQLKINSLSDTDIENLSTLDCTLELTVHFMSAQHIYQVLHCIGGLVKSLSIKNTGRYSEIILERILAACPNLEHFAFQYYCSVVQDPEYNMSPAAFKNYKSFKIDCCKDEYLKDDVVLQQGFRKFLIGTEVCEKLKLKYVSELQVLAEVALEYPESLQQLREVYIPRIFTDCSNFEASKYYYELFTCCHKLENIFFRQCDEEFVKNWIHENRYLFTIQYIDPHFIKYSGR